MNVWLVLGWYALFWSAGSLFAFPQMCDVAPPVVAARQRKATIQEFIMRPRVIELLALARVALTQGFATPTTSTWVVPPASRSSCRCLRRRLSRCRVQPSASIGSGNLSEGGGIGTERPAKPLLKVKVKMGQRGGRSMYAGSCISAAESKGQCGSKRLRCEM